MTTPAARIWVFCDSTSSRAQRMAAPRGVNPPASSCGGVKSMASVQSPMVSTLLSPPKEMTSTRPQRAAIGSALRSDASAFSPSFSNWILFSSCMLPEQSSTSTSGARSSLLSMRATSGMTVFMCRFDPFDVASLKAYSGTHRNTLEPRGHPSSMRPGVLIHFIFNHLQGPPDRRSMSPRRAANLRTAVSLF